MPRPIQLPTPAETFIAAATALVNANPGDMDSSARVCLADAWEHIAAGRQHRAAQRALRAVAYAVGYFHPEYRAMDAAARKIA